MRDFSGQRFGRLTVIRPIGKDSTNHTLWECKCDCGNTKVVVAYGLTKTKGGTRSCGCLSKEYSKSGNARRSHGGCGTRLYRIWKLMKNRCNNPNSEDYKKWYGSFNISVCDEWQNDFEAFRSWAIENGYNDSLSIDRIDYTKGYSPSNCKWSTAKEQANNRRGVDTIEFNGQSHTISEWGQITGYGRSTIYNRIKVYHWNIERALTTPKRR